MLTPRLWDVSGYIDAPREDRYKGCERQSFPTVGAVLSPLVPFLTVLFGSFKLCQVSDYLVVRFHGYKLCNAQHVTRETRLRLFRKPISMMRSGQGRKEFGIRTTCSFHDDGGKM